MATESRHDAAEAFFDALYAQTDESPDVIRYAYLGAGGVEESAEWSGQYGSALAAGVRYLDAEETASARYEYHSTETGSRWIVDAADVATLGAAVLAGRGGQAYSLWCAATEATEVRS